MLSSPENRELVGSWVQAIFPLILDVETKARFSVTWYLPPGLPVSVDT